jgi:hypothetical protein
MAYIDWSICEVDGSHYKKVGAYSLRVYKNLSGGFTARLSSYEDWLLVEQHKTLKDALACANVMLMDEVAELAEQIGMKLVRW